MLKRAQSFSSLPTIARGIAIVGFMPLLFLSLTSRERLNGERRKALSSFPPFPLLVSYPV
jgi:hypothetical protein